MKKFCIFCGQFPESKNREHVIPQWLIKATGDPKRIASFGVDFGKKPYAPRQFSFNGLTFPACSKCNSTFGYLETTAEPVIRKLLSRQALSNSDLIVLLDWLDKVRVGLWLGYLYLDKNPFGIKPSYHILQRLGQFDRAVTIIEFADKFVGLSFRGPEFKHYQLSPTCFSILINGFCLINASGMSLCSGRLGFPYVEPVRVRDDRKTEVELQRGTARVRYPVERSNLLPNSVSLYQPVFRMFLRSAVKEYLECDWVASHTANFESGNGKVFLQRDGSVRVYPDVASEDWIPSETWDAWKYIEHVPRHVYGRLSKDVQTGIALTSNRDQRKSLRRWATAANKIDRAILRNIEQVLFD